MKLYKFRSLANCKDLTHAKDILEKGKFWCSRYWKLNDPMEGVYKYKAGTIPGKYIEELFGEKATYVICSFSGAKAFKDPLVWGYYANGFKGIAIEIEVEDNLLIPITYSNAVPTINSNNQFQDNVKLILTSKLCCWSHEDEYRFLTKNSPNLYPIGNITAVYYGKPYITKKNEDEAQLRPRIQEYLCRIELLEKTSNKVNEEKKKSDKIPFNQVEVVDGEVHPNKINNNKKTTDS